MASIKKTKKSVEQPVQDVFANAVQVPVEEPKKPAGKKDKRKEIDFGEIIDVYSAITTVTKALGTLAATYENDIKTKALDEYVELGMEIDRKPDNFRAVGERSSAVIQLKKRSSSSPLSEKEVETLENFGVEAYEHVETDIEERYFFNPAIMADPKLMKILSAKISEAVASIPELNGQQVIMLQPAQKNVKKIVTDETIDAVFSLKKQEAVETCLKIITSTAISSPILNEDVDMALALEMIKGVIGGDDK